MNQTVKRSIGAKRSIRVVGGLGGGAAPLPLNQNKQSRQHPKPVAPTVQEIAGA